MQLKNFGPISETPGTSPQEMEKLPYVHLRRLKGEPTPEKKSVAPTIPVNELVPSGDTIEKEDEAQDTGSESDHPEISFGVDSLLVRFQHLVTFAAEP